MSNQYAHQRSVRLLRHQYGLFSNLGSRRLGQKRANKNKFIASRQNATNGERYVSKLLIPSCREKGTHLLFQRWDGEYAPRMSLHGVRRDKAAFPSGCKSHPATAPAGAVMEIMIYAAPSTLNGGLWPIVSILVAKANDR